jgi:hypothetical protein
MHVRIYVCLYAYKDIYRHLTLRLWASIPDSCRKISCSNVGPEIAMATEVFRGFPQFSKKV